MSEFGATSPADNYRTPQPGVNVIPEYLHSGNKLFITAGNTGHGENPHIALELNAGC